MKRVTCSSKESHVHEDAPQRTHERRTVTLSFTAILALFLVFGCRVGSTPHESTVSSTFVPRSVSNLRNTTSGTIHFDLTVNGQKLVDSQLADDSESSVSLNAADLSDTVNEIRIDFYLRLQDGMNNLLATAVQAVPKVTAGASIILSGLFYTYTDSDDDGLYDVHELGVKPDDVDGDNLKNHQDNDSDGDGTPDGHDPNPYGEAMNGQDTSTQLQFELIHTDGKSENLIIDHIIGIEDEVIHLVNTLGEVSLRSPALWPSSSPLAETTNRRWTTFGLGRGDNSLCPGWRISIDTSSIKSSLSDTSLLYFRRHDGPSFAAPIAASEIPNLNSIENEGAANNSGFWDDGLRIILVPGGTVGWLELYTGANFTGELCRLNLSTPVGIFP